jgi:mannitol-1-phosphate/altronate dehydrogenase
LAEESIWKSNLNAIPGLTDLVVQYLDSIQSIGMLETVKTIL